MSSQGKKLLHCIERQFIPKHLYDYCKGIIRAENFGHDRTVFRDEFCAQPVALRNIGGKLNAEPL